jgi:hypothetical protein
MTLKEKFDEVFIENWLVDYAEECEKVTDDFAIGFTEWRLTTFIKNVEQYTTKELLEIYKKERGL